jgi:hypothetical protein
VVPVSDERRAPAGSAGRTRRTGGARHPGAVFRFEPDVATALEAEARESGRSKVSIVEDVLRRRYRIKRAA